MSGAAPRSADMRIGLIGATGWIGAALGTRLLTSGIVTPSGLVAMNRSGNPGPYKPYAIGWAGDPAELVARVDVVIVAVRPETWPGLRLQAPGKLLISLMAGVGSGDLARSGGRVVRAMPNAAAETGKSYSPFWAGADVTKEDRNTVHRILGAIGTFDELPKERQIDMMTAVSGSGAAYPSLMMVAMVDVMKRHGIPDGIAWHAAKAAVCDGAALLAGHPQRAQSFLTAYQDYAGTTATGLDAAERGGFSTALRTALEAAAERARTMAGAGAV
ncbi:pyrroline-5-carboxylate reductase family protein [Haematobacter genomosp. 1]|nr:pyrroline-5-carboxylate reductase dimerization domain-containing protein [Haematobacter genomosp. 1]